MRERPLPAGEAEEVLVWAPRPVTGRRLTTRTSVEDGVSLKANSIEAQRCPQEWPGRGWARPYGKDEAP
ncbi:hypothetical protein [Alicyclobacillus acidocaldarius]|uniref:hypothetical protein n=1 Tax=Alicyclobacillus acidocaldarius TaxID=405212 RepID=UPI001C54F0CE|nr:hypothetical protein [Alicyclobacillus acidocaldarius]